MSVGEHVVTAFPVGSLGGWAAVSNTNPNMDTGLTGWKQTGSGVWVAGSGVLTATVGAGAFPTIQSSAATALPRDSLDRYRITGAWTTTGKPKELWLGAFATPNADGSGAGAVWLGDIFPITKGPRAWSVDIDLRDVPASLPWLILTFQCVFLDAANGGNGGTVTLDSLTFQRAVEGLDISCLVDEVAIVHGRDDTTNQPEASAATIALDLTDTELPDTVDIGSDLVVTTTLASTTSVRFHGRVTDMALGFDDVGEATPESGHGQLNAVGYLAEMGRRVVGDAPFPQELDGARVQRIMSLAGFIPNAVTSDPGQVQVTARDIDARSALEVAQDTAQSATGVLWQTRDSDVRYADSSHRRNIPSSLVLDSCDVLVTPTWSRTIQGLVNKVTLAYGIAPSGGEQPTTSASNTQSISRYGTYDYSLTTELAALADAQAMASLLLARNSTPVWLMTALPVDVKSLSDDDTSTLLSLEMHALVTLTGLPVIAPTIETTAHLWVEGWSERLAWGVHEIELHVSGYCRTAPAPRWDDLDDLPTWDEQTGTWNDAACLGPPVSHDRWTDVPASLRWDTATTTWDTYQGGAR